MKIKAKRVREQKVIGEMIDLYCCKNHNTKKKELCEQCKKLHDYANRRTELCRFMEEKTFCSNCKVHCYKPEMRIEIQKVMRFSGPRIVIHHPIMALSHLISSKLEKHKQKKNSSS